MGVSVGSVAGGGGGGWMGEGGKLGFGGGGGVWMWEGRWGAEMGWESGVKRWEREGDVERWDGVERWVRW